MSKSLEIIKPDDWHVHFREDEMLSVLTKFSSRVNRRCIAMPNTLIPITSSHQALNYKNLSGLSNEVKSKFKKIRPKTMGQALRIDGITPAAVFILLSHLKRKSIKHIA